MTDISVVFAAFHALHNNISFEKELHLSFPLDPVNAFRLFPVGEYIKRLSGYRKLSLGGYHHGIYRSVLFSYC